ncbi:MAG: phospholipase D-like domain-containing protein [Chitinophagaceae bacterium]
MSDILIEGGSMVLAAAAPFDVRFDAAADIIMPFGGTIVVPAAAGEIPVIELMGHHRWMFISCKYPETGEGGKRKFPFLRDMENRAVTTDRPVIMLVADDHTLLDDIHPSKLDDDITETYKATFKENYIISSAARYLLIEFDNGLFTSDGLPLAISPFSCDAEFKLKGNTSDDEGMELLRTALSQATALAGRIRAFDIGGRQTEAYSALLKLGVKKEDIQNFPDADADAEKKMKVQFVDLHGNVLHKNDYPLDHLDISPALQNVPGTLNYYEWEFSDDTRKIDFKLTEQAQPEAEVGMLYTHHFHYVCIWPGYGFKFKEITKAGEATTIDLLKDVEPDDFPKLTFVRICVFHPLPEFQDKAGGEIQAKQAADSAGIQQKYTWFADNHFQFFSARNSVSIYNTGDEFFKDYFDTVTSLDKDDELYQANWSSQPFIHLPGSMKVRRIEPADWDSDSARSKLQQAALQSVLLPVNIDAQTVNAVMLPQRINGGAIFTDSMAVEVSTVPGPGRRPKRTHKGFVRKNNLYAWLLDMDTAAGEAVQHSVLGYWKTSMGIAISVPLQKLLPDVIPAMESIGIPFPADIVVLQAGPQDPSQLQIVRTKSIPDIRSAINRPGGAEVLQLLVINLASGGAYFLPLSPAEQEETATNIEITNILNYDEGSVERTAIEELTGTFSALDNCLFAVCRAPAAEDDALLSLLLTGLSLQRFSDNALRLGDVPLHPEELGGLFRTAISKRVKLKALYWEQYLASLVPSADLAKGVSNNESITNVINRDIAGKNGFAFRDRSTRDFGSWHQKATVIFKEDRSTDIFPEGGYSFTSYLGGMDLAMGRWDTPFHFDDDPERQSGLWFDVHVKIFGEAGFDVMRNFKHRWEAIKAFLDFGMDKFRPVNSSQELNDELENGIKIPDPQDIQINFPEGPNAFVQINRTIPPRSSLSLDEVEDETLVTIPDRAGELGSMHSYVKAINNARRFIIINDQYFFSQEMAKLLHDRLAAPDGPDFLVLVLPLNLGESDYIDPHLFRVRELAIHTLYFGAAVQRDDLLPTDSQCGNIFPDPGLTNSVKDKVVILTPTTTAGTPIYVHSKHMIVDDVWMTIGSANMGARSLTYDGEINAAIVARKLYKGVGDIVRNHRIQICRQLSGLPLAYSALLQDPYAAFRLLKATEAQQDDPSLRLHPAPPMTTWLDPEYRMKVGETAFDDNADVVAELDFRNESFKYITCNGLDPDGRTNVSTRLAMIFGFAGIGKTLPSAIANITFNFSQADIFDIKFLVDQGIDVRLIIRVNITVMVDDVPQAVGPFDVDTYLLIFSAVANNIVLKDEPTNKASVHISTTEKYEVIGEVFNEETLPGTRILQGSAVFDPAANPPIIGGSVRDAVINLA